jgi:hypothetical protein
MARRVDINRSTGEKSLKVSKGKKENGKKNSTSL